MTRPAPPWFWQAKIRRKLCNCVRRISGRPLLVRPAFADLKHLWAMVYSRSALLESDRWLDKMEVVSSDGELLSALVCAVIAAYGRPFTQSQVAPGERIVPLGNVAPPKHLESTHRDLLNMRNKVIGHKDATPASGHTETPNVLILRRDNTGFDLHTAITQEMAPDLRKRLRNCAPILSRTVISNLKSL